MSVLCLNICSLCVPYIMSLNVHFIKKIAPCQSWCVCLTQRQSCVIFGVRFDRRKDD